MADPETTTTEPLYDTDILLWSEQQAELLRRRSANALDWDNLMEEIEAVGRNELHAVMSHLRLALLHDLKAEAWPLLRDVPHWRAEARLHRDEARQHFTPRWRSGSTLRNSIARRGAACRRRLTGLFRCRYPKPAR